MESRHVAPPLALPEGAVQVIADHVRGERAPVLKDEGVLPPRMILESGDEDTAQERMQVHRPHRELLGGVPLLLTDVDDLLVEVDVVDLGAQHLRSPTARQGHEGEQ